MCEMPSGPGVTLNKDFKDENQGLANRVYVYSWHLGHVSPGPPGNPPVLEDSFLVECFLGFC